jgi:hypothetical protein
VARRWQRIHGPLQRKAAEVHRQTQEHNGAARMGDAEADDAQVWGAPVEGHNAYVGLAAAAAAVDAAAAPAAPTVVSTLRRSGDSDEDQRRRTSGAVGRG